MGVRVTAQGIARHGRIVILLVMMGAPAAHIYTTVYIPKVILFSAAIKEYCIPNATRDTDVLEST